MLHLFAQLLCLAQRQGERSSYWPSLGQTLHQHLPALQQRHASTPGQEEEAALDVTLLEKAIQAINE